MIKEVLYDPKKNRDTSFGGTKYNISTQTYVNGNSTVDIKSTNGNIDHQILEHDMIEFIYNNVLANFVNKLVTCYTQYKRKGDIFYS